MIVTGKTAKFELENSTGSIFPVRKAEKRQTVIRIKMMAAFIFGLSLIMLFLLNTTAYANSANPFPYQVKQADDTVITIYNRGDEFFNWREDTDGFVIAYDAENANWCYAYISGDGEILPGGEVVGGSPTRGGTRIRDTDLIPILINVDRNAGQAYDPPGSGQYGGVSGPIQSGIPPVDQVKHTQPLLVLLIEYNNQQFLPYYAQAPGLDTTGYWSEHFFGTGNSVNTYFAEVSGSFNLQFTKPNFTVEDGFSVQNHPISSVSSVLIKDGVALVRLNRNHPDTINGGNLAVDIELAFDAVKHYTNIAGIGKYYNTVLCEDFNVTSVIAGYDASSGGDDERLPSVWAHASWWYFPNVNGRQKNISVNFDMFSPNDGSPGVLRTYATQGELRFDDYGESSNYSMPLGVTVHELGHVLGLEDLYSYIGGEGIGPYSLMAQGSWGRTSNTDLSGNTPTHLDAWSKIRLGFATPITIPSTDYWAGSVNSIQENYNILKITNTAVDSKQYFIVENRQFYGYDLGLVGMNVPNSGGILIYHIDYRVFEGYVYDGNVWRLRPNDNNFHKAVDLEGFPGNPFYVSGRLFDDSTVPNSHFHADGHDLNPPPPPPPTPLNQGHVDCCPQNLPTGIRIRVTSPSGAAMSVIIGGPAFIFGDVNGDGVINAADVIRLARYVADQNVQIDERAAKVTGEDTPVGFMDLLRLVKYIAGHDVKLGE